MSGGAAERRARGAALAVLTALLTAAGHIAGGGRVPDLAVLAVLLPLLAAVLVSLAQRCRGPVSTVATLAVGQLVLHELMTVLHPAHGVAGPTALNGSSMLAMHAAATLVTAVALRHADAAVVALAAALRRGLPRAPRPLPPADRPLPTCAVPGAELPARVARLIFVAHARRGPPVGC